MFVCLHACSQDFQKGGLHGCVHASIVHNFKAYKTGGGGGGGGGSGGMLPQGIFEILML